VANVKKAKTVLQEVLATGVNSGHVRGRVRDWRARIDGLYDQLEEWLPEGWKAVRSRTIPMNEPMMKAHGVRGIKLPCLELRGPKRKKVILMPDSLWVVGFNGRIDAKTATGHYIIVDVAEIMAEPQWRLTGMYKRPSRYILNKRRLAWLLARP
jgi:hypothetical protein